MTGEVVKKGRGGARPGAGRKARDGAKGVGSVTITMDEDTERIAYELGNGNYGEGVRRAIAELIRLRKAAKGIVSTKPAPPAQNAPQPRNPLLRQKKEEAPAPTGPTWRTGIPVSNDWD